MGQNMFEPRIHVLLVDNDNNESPMVQMLEYVFSHQVTTVKNASTALSIIATEGRNTFDLVLENVNAFDWCGVAFLQRAEDIGLPVILLLDEDDAVLTLKALELGASLCLKKPLSMERAKYLWQYAYYHKLHVRKEDTAQSVKELGWTNGYGPHWKMERCSTIVAQGDGLGRMQQHYGHVELPKKNWIEWTAELHEKFMDAVRYLGEGRCYPKNILEVMNVPGLTRMQVASHLQKCRSGTWHLFPKGRRFPNSSAPRRSSSAWNGSGLRRRAAPKRYGKMPQLCLDKLPVEESSNNMILATTTTTAADHQLPSSGGGGDSDQQQITKWCPSGSHPFPDHQHPLDDDQFEGFNIDEAFMNTVAQLFLFDGCTPSDADGSNNAIAEDFFDINIPNMVDFVGLASTSQLELALKSIEDSNEIHAIEDEKEDDGKDDERNKVVKSEI